MSENNVEQKTPAPGGTTGADTSSQRGRGGARRAMGKKPPFRKNSRFKSERPAPEFEQKIINISRVTRVVKGGRRLSFRVDMVIGDKKGRIGLGSGKATDTSLAIQKAFAQAKKNLIKVRLTKANSLEHAVSGKVTSSYVDIMPNRGRGLIAGSTARTVFQLAGITDTTAKFHSRSKNKLNNAKATILALQTFAIPFEPVVRQTNEEKGRFFTQGNRDNRGGRERKSFSPQS
ncbi:MAG: 30S ribosomal protein S5 [Candidatus Pacebacteria bacterium]|nr:30S ribosomal protein S5 [Candidatus Paceibacterota bacterium]